jgi:hypothetical protein
MAEQRGMVIHFMDGSKKLLEFPKQLADDAAAASKIEDALKARHLVVEAEGALLVFPFDNIKYVQVSPAPKKLPGFAIKAAAFKD